MTEPEARADGALDITPRDESLTGTQARSSLAGRGSDLTSDEPLRDPYFHPAESFQRASQGAARVSASPPSPANAELGATSLWTLLLGPIGSLASIAFGIAGRRRARRLGDGGPGLRMANAGIALGVVMSIAWASALGWVLVQRHRDAGSALAESDDSSPSDPARNDPGPDPGVPNGLPIPKLPIPTVTSAPQRTKIDRVGAIEVIDVGAASSSLVDELSRQRAAAGEAGERMLVMTTAGKCDPCRGVDKSLRDRLLQTALDKVRLVRVDVDVFGDDLKSLKVPVKAIPGFFLLAPDLTPRDGVNGGEWDDDIPPNIAPVLGAFVKGKYGKRREMWKPPPGSGISL